MKTAVDYFINVPTKAAAEQEMAEEAALNAEEAATAAAQAAVQRDA